MRLLPFRVTEHCVFVWLISLHVIQLQSQNNTVHSQTSYIHYMQAHTHTHVILKAHEMHVIESTLNKFLLEKGVKQTKLLR